MRKFTVRSMEVGELLDLVDMFKTKGVSYEIKLEKVYGKCENCDNISSDVKLESGQWLCENCKDELVEVK